MENTRDVIEAIRAGKFTSNELERIELAIRSYREDLAYQLRPGDRVQVRRTARPKYLAGSTGVVQRHVGERVLVLMDTENRHHRVSGREWRMSFGSIEKIASCRRIRLVWTDDPYTKMKPGIEGTVTYVDSLGTLHGEWDDGSTLGLIPGHDKYEWIEQEET